MVVLLRPSPIRAGCLYGLAEKSRLAGAAHKAATGNINEGPPPAYRAGAQERQAFRFAVHDPVPLGECCRCWSPKIAAALFCRASVRSRCPPILLRRGVVGGAGWVRCWLWVVFAWCGLAQSVDGVEKAHVISLGGGLSCLIFPCLLWPKRPPTVAKSCFAVAKNMVKNHF